MTTRTKKILQEKQESTVSKSGLKADSTKEQKTESSIETNDKKTLKIDQQFYTHFFKSKNLVIISGAGISVSSGIPDFRSSDGLYNLLKQKYPNQIYKGKDLFDASLFQTPSTTLLFYSFITSLKKSIEEAKPTKTHMFFNKIHDRLLRHYTQNIDGLDFRMNPADKLIEMHGDVRSLKCTLCDYICDFDQTYIDLFDTFDTTIDGKNKNSIPACPTCTTKSKARVESGKRAIPVGFLRPNVVLYNEHHPKGDDIAELINKDMKKVDMLFVCGTSLKIVGVKNMIKSVREKFGKLDVINGKKKGLIVYINKTKASKEWDNVFDYQFVGDADEVFGMMEEEMIKREKKDKGQTVITDFFKTEKVKGVKAKSEKIAPKGESKGEADKLEDKSVEGKKSRATFKGNDTKLAPKAKEKKVEREKKGNS